MVGRPRKTERQKAQTARDRYLKKWNQFYEVGGPSHWCIGQNKKKKAVVAGRTTKKTACATYRKGARSRKQLADMVWKEKLARLIREAKAELASRKRVGGKAMRGKKVVKRK